MHQDLQGRLNQLVVWKKSLKLRNCHSYKCGVLTQKVLYKDLKHHVTADLWPLLLGQYIDLKVS